MYGGGGGGSGRSAMVGFFVLKGWRAVDRSLVGVRRRRARRKLRAVAVACVEAAKEPNTSLNLVDHGE